jgi:hypothetical protein
MRREASRHPASPVMRQAVPIDLEAHVVALFVDQELDPVEVPGS